MSNLRVVRDGVIVGLIASVSVALFYAAFDVVAARGPLYTVDLLGKALFRGMRDPAALQVPIQPDMGAIAAFDALHLVASLAIGVVVTWLASQAERREGKAYVAGAVIVAGFVVTVLAVGQLTTFMRHVLPMWSIVGANLAAVVTAGWYLVRRSPGIAPRLLPIG